MKIVGFFSNIKRANEAVNKLKKEGFKNANFDINDDFRKDRNVITNLPGTEYGESLSDLVLESGSSSFLDRSKAPLAAANPSVSGMGNMEEITDVNCKVVVEVNKENMKKAKEIISSLGGEFNNPNIKEPEITGNEDKIFDISMDKLRRDFR